jgi:lysophospholipase L1-like esterase
MSPSPLTSLSSRRQVLTAGLLAAFGSMAAAEVLAGGHAVAALRGNSATRISVVGDSLTIGTLPYQVEALSAVGWDFAAIDAYGSRGIRTKARSDHHTGLTSVDAIRAGSGDSDLWIVALGTNDAVIYGRAKHAELINTMMDRIGAGHYVMWVNVYLPAAPARQRHWNTSLELVAEERGNEMFVLDWASLVVENPKWMADDDIHCSGKGYQHRATAIASATRSLVPSTPPDPGPFRTGRLWTQIPPVVAG